MKKLFVLAVLLMVTPAMAAVTITADVNGCDVTVSFNNTEPNHVRAFALDITADDANIVDANNFIADYNIYPGDINISGGDVCDLGSPIGDATEYPGVTQPGLGSSGITVEMGSLYVGEGNAPVDSGTLFKITVDNDCNVTISANAARGGIVMENPQASSNDNLNVVAEVNSCGAGPCYTGPDVTEWQNVGSPTSWCDTRQCHGNADGLLNPYGRGGAQSAYVSSEDVKILIDGFRKTYGGAVAPTWIAADFDHKLNAYGRGGAQSARISSEDVSILIYHFRDKNGVPPADCLTGSPSSP
jgi:hypothetical protein